MNLQELLQPWCDTNNLNLPAINITGICEDSRVIQPGELFIARRGAQYDGGKFIAEAIQKGAVAVLADQSINLDSKLNFLKPIKQIFIDEKIISRASADEKKLSIKSIGKKSFRTNSSQKQANQTSLPIPFITLPLDNRLIAAIAARFYGNPAQRLKTIGVTGTNGKTSIAFLTSTALNLLDRPTAYIGTIGTGFAGKEKLIELANTTPSSILLQQMLADYYKRHAQYITMEVSSHALAQDRVASIPFEVGIFTNVTRDHLDYHGSMENYGRAKQTLFLDYTPRYSIINLDDEFGQKILQELPSSTQKLSISLQSSHADIYGQNVHYSPQGIEAAISTPWGSIKLTTTLLGEFNLQNLLLILSTLLVLEIPLETAAQTIAQLKEVPGRMQRFSETGFPTVVVDYSHTPDALAKALSVLKRHCEHKLWCVFGCGGDRDPGKRPLMGAIAYEYADHIVVTDDNPRFEASQNIIEAILQGIPDQQSIYVEPDRRAAIEYAIQHASEKDIVLIAGKGHENYQQVGDIKLPFDDSEIVKKFFK